MNAMIKIARMTPPAQNEEVLQPLREVGQMQKTQFWDMDEIYAALREAKRLGIAPENLFGKAQEATSAA